MAPGAPPSMSIRGARRPPCRCLVRVRVPGFSVQSACYALDVLLAPLPRARPALPSPSQRPASSGCGRENTALRPPNSGRSRPDSRERDVLLQPFQGLHEVKNLSVELSALLPFTDGKYVTCTKLSVFMCCVCPGCMTPATAYEASSHGYGSPL